jgi:hypothetical protein
MIVEAGFLLESLVFGGLDQYLARNEGAASGA